MKEEYLDTPTEITDSSRAQQMLTRAQKQKEEYEETYLTRLPVTKAEKHRQRKLTTLGNIQFSIPWVSRTVEYVRLNLSIDTRLCS